MCRMCDSATHAALNSPKPRACLRLTPYRPTNAASRSLHSYQPYAWLRHTPYLRTAQILKPRCRVCAVRTHAFFAWGSLYLRRHKSPPYTQKKQPALWNTSKVQAAFLLRGVTAYSITTRAFSGCTGRLLCEPMARVNFSACAWSMWS